MEICITRLNTIDKNLKLTKTELENYAILVMTLGINADGEWEMDEKKARDFYSNLANVLPEEIGAVLSPMPINKISFEKSNVGDTDTIAAAEQKLYTAAGVSSLLFNNEKASSNALAALHQGGPGNHLRNRQEYRGRGESICPEPVLREEL